MKRTGLALGKFAPFHRGHQFLLETALAEVDRLVVIVYEAKLTTAIPLSTRAGWIRSLYPAVEVLEAPGAPEDVGYSPEIMRRQEGFLASFLQGRKIDAFYSSEPYGEHVSGALGCLDRRVDEARLRHPISASRLRAEPALRPLWLDPLVRADLVRRLVLLGAPSTGKTTLAAALASRLGEPWCPEFGRDYWFQHQVDHRLTMADLEIIAREQAVLEKRLARDAGDILVVDTCPLTTWVYARYWYGRTSPLLDGILEDYLAFPREYRLCDADFPFEDTPDRSGPASRELLQRLTREELARRHLPCPIVSGDPETRVEALLASLSSASAQGRSCPAIV